jgi:uncharacterized caspase-like protein
MSRKLALIIGNSQYQDPRLAQLVTPQEDVNDLADILRMPDIGSFDEVTTLVNESDANIRLSIEDFFADKKPDDLLVIYFSGHGVRDEQGQLYLAVNNTRANRLRATAIPSEFITTEMDRSRSKRQVLILDCCHSGAFAQGSKAMTGESAGTGPAFKGIGYGRVVLTATDATQYAWEGDKVIGQADRSVFTHYLIEGLRTGAADADHDGTITLDEMYDYVYEKVITVTPKQTPGKWSYKQQGDIVIARNPQAEAKPVPPSSEIVDTARHLSAVPTAVLVVQQGINPGATYPLRGAINTIGRNEGLEVTLRDTLSSRRHARITRNGNDYVIEDLLSANGTFVNGKKLAAPQPLKDGDQISVGDTTLIFRLRWTAAAAPLANDQTSVARQPAIALAAHATVAEQPKPPAISSQPTGPMPTVVASTLASRIAPKWIWLGVAGGIILLLVALYVIVRPTPGPASTEPTVTEPAPTEPASTESRPAAGAVTSSVQPTIRSTSTRPPTARSTITSIPDTATLVPPTATRVPPTRTRVPPTRTPNPPTAVPPTAVPPTAPPPPTEVPPPPPIVVENAYSVSVCCGPTGTQISDQLDFSASIYTIDLLQLRFATAAGCSDVQLHVFLDGAEIYTSEFLGPITGNTSVGWLDLGPVSPGDHTLILRPEGRVTGLPGDCNSGTLGGWAGTLQVRTNYSP